MVIGDVSSTKFVSSPVSLNNISETAKIIQYES